MTSHCLGCGKRITYELPLRGKMRLYCSQPCNQMIYLRRKRELGCNAADYSPEIAKDQNDVLKHWRARQAQLMARALK